MRLISATVRSYRVHRELHVDFDASRTLIGGPNESGKSTLIEAIHRALFLKSKITGDAQREMVSTIHPGPPEVEVVFDASGTKFQVNKRFSGNSGTTRLAEEGRPTLLGEEAEERLSAVLRVESIGGGRGAADRVVQQWAHLWAWQGRNGDDPTDHANAQHDNLLQRLQSMGGAAAMQSPLDTEVSSHFAALDNKTFFREKPKVGSDLAEAEAAKVAAGEVLQSAELRLATLSEAIRAHNEATLTLAQFETESTLLAGQLTAVTARQGELEKLGRLEAAQALEVKSAMAKLDDLIDARDQIDRMRGTIRALESELAPKNAEIIRLEAKWNVAKSHFDRASAAHKLAIDEERGARLIRDLAAASLRKFEIGTRRDELRAKESQVLASKGTIAALRQELARLPEIDAAKLKKITRLESELSSANATLRAMAAGLDILAANLPVLVDGVLLENGASKTLVENTEIAVGAGVRIRVRPGGGTSLAEARQGVAEREGALQTILYAVGVSSVARASEAVLQRSEIVRKVELAESTLVALNADNLTTALDEALDSFTASEAEVSRRVEEMPDYVHPTTIEEARTRAEREAQLLGAAETAERSSKRSLEAEEKSLADVDVALENARNEVREQQAQASKLSAQLGFLIETRGSDEARSQALECARSENDAAGASLASTRSGIAALQPELIEMELARIQRAKRILDETRHEAGAKLAVAQVTLRSEGDEDPETIVALARSRFDSAQEDLASVRRRADAIRLLHQLFQDGQRSLSEQFTRPLAEKISEYLGSLLGAGTRVNVVLSDNSFSGLELVRPSQGGEALAFATLSGGTREQVGSAVRLAMAEVLAPDHGGCLPVVFDDGFAYSDPDRVQKVQRMLDLAAGHGLQVIVLSCNPIDYMGLGARQIRVGVITTAVAPVAEKASTKPE